MVGIMTRLMPVTNILALAGGVDYLISGATGLIGGGGFSVLAMIDGFNPLAGSIARLLAGIGIATIFFSKVVKR